MQTTVVLVALQGMSHEEAAIIQNCSAGTVAWRIHKARIQLRKALEANGQRAQTPRPVPDLSAPTNSSTARLSPELNRLLHQWGLPALAPG
jgi:RNA polymerase sigma-70 factor (ECF subfamily)